MKIRKVLMLLLVSGFFIMPLSASGKKDTKKATSTPTPATPTVAPASISAVLPVSAPVVDSPPAVRYYQSDSQIAYSYDLDSTMSNSGCCFMSCLGIAQTHAGKNLTADQINMIRNEAYGAGEMNSDFTVKNIPAVINRGFSKLGKSLSARVVSVSSTYQTTICDSTLIRGDLDGGGDHWVEGYSNGEIKWNPYETAIITTVTKIFYIKISGYL
jgi:hypothetical protein